jgi:hypothetical protein
MGAPFEHDVDPGSRRVDGATVDAGIRGLDGNAGARSERDVADLGGLSEEDDEETTKKSTPTPGT